MCNYIGQLYTVYRFVVNAATLAVTQTAYGGDHRSRFSLDSPENALEIPRPETGFKYPSISQTNSFL